ncbi:prepilin-type N-terminal cleavage/methylation domain-containing protein [bacterium]|nr:prepilin-type N-terminal cleavage/methylation domain-containing protein [bacterium]
MNLRRHQNGFTLLEILIAMGITGIVIMIMSSVYINATRLWLSTDVCMKAQQKARNLLSGDPHLQVKKRTENVEWQGILNELQDMCILLPAYPGGTSTLDSNKIRFATEAYIQDGGNNLCNSKPAAILYGTQRISDTQVGTSGMGAGTIFIIHGEDGKFRSTPGDTNGDRVMDETTDDILYGRIIIGPDGTISTGVRTGSDDSSTGNTAVGSILINQGPDNSLQSILGDYNGDGDLLDSGGDQQNPDDYIVGDVISYEFDADEKTITRIINDGLGTETIGTDIAEFSLNYYDNDHNLTTDISNVKQIGGTVTVTIPKKFGAANATYTLTFNAHPRKLNSAFGGK